MEKPISDLKFNTLRLKTKAWLAEEVMYACVCNSRLKNEKKENKRLLAVRNSKLSKVLALSIAVNIMATLWILCGQQIIESIN